MDQLQVTTQDQEKEKVISIPRALYESWLEITYQLTQVDKVPLEDAQKRLYTMLRNWILAYHPTCKLCAFEEVTEEDKHKYARPDIELGMYVKLREMSPENLKLSMQMNKEGKLGKEGNPQWILETEHIAELGRITHMDYPPENITKERPLLPSEMSPVSGEGTPWMPLIEVWTEGYAATGESGTATLLWKGPAENFDDAVMQFNASRKKEELKAEHYPERKRSKWYYWGCALFDNEADARKAFG